MRDLRQLMDACFDRGASDLHLSVGRPPVIRVHGELEELPGAPLEPDELAGMVTQILPSVMPTATSAASASASSPRRARAGSSCD
jgi:twitching motility protein PilT